MIQLSEFRSLFFYFLWLIAELTFQCKMSQEQNVWCIALLSTDTEANEIIQCSFISPVIYYRNINNKYDRKNI